MRIQGRMMLVLVVGLVVGAGCATPASRIKRNPELFASFPPEVQTNIRLGRIALGYNREMVAMALGQPARVRSRITLAGTNEVWVYTSVSTRTQLQPVAAGYWTRDLKGRAIYTSGTTWVDIHDQQETELLRIEFDGSKVTSIETPR